MTDPIDRVREMARELDAQNERRAAERARYRPLPEDLAWRLGGPDPLAELAALARRREENEAKLREAWQAFVVATVARRLGRETLSIASWFVFRLGWPDLYFLRAESPLAGGVQFRLPGPDILNAARFARPAEWIGGRAPSTGCYGILIRPAVPPPDAEAMKRLAETEIGLVAGRAAAALWARIDALPGRWSGLAPVAAECLEGLVPP